jgi:hypothetical protein
MKHDPPHYGKNKKSKSTKEKTKDDTSQQYNSKTGPHKLDVPTGKAAATTGTPELSRVDNNGRQDNNTQKNTRRHDNNGQSNPQDRTWQKYKDPTRQPAVDTEQYLYKDRMKMKQGQTGHKRRHRTTYKRSRQQKRTTE